MLFVAWCCLIIISCLFSCLLNTYCLFFCWCLVVQIFVFFIISSCLPDCLVTQCSLLVCYLLICCLLDYTASSPVCPSLQYQNFAITNSLSVLLHCRFVQTIAFWEFKWWLCLRNKLKGQMQALWIVKRFSFVVGSLQQVSRKENSR